MAGNAGRTVSKPVAVRTNRIGSCTFLIDLSAVVRTVPGLKSDGAFEFFSGDMRFRVYVPVTLQGDDPQTV